MATRQTRWLCATCGREWVHAHQWNAEDGCPGCRSSAIRTVDYQPSFAGGDIPRDGRPASPATPAVGRDMDPVTPPPHVLMAGGEA